MGRPTFAGVLAALRRERRLSQLALALRAGVSQRQISMLECRRATPRRATVARLAGGLALDAVETRALFEAAGFALPREGASASARSATHEPFGHTSRPPHAAALAIVRQDLSPWPHCVTDGAGEILHASPAFEALIALAFDGGDVWSRVTPGGGRNFFDLSVHPDGLRRCLANPEEILPGVSRRLRLAALRSDAARAVLERNRPHLDPGPARGETGADRGSSEGIAERYRVAGRDLAFRPLEAVLATPEAGEVTDLRLDVFLPADGESRSCVLGLAAAGDGPA